MKRTRFPFPAIANIRWERAAGIVLIMLVASGCVCGKKETAAVEKPPATAATKVNATPEVGVWEYMFDGETLTGWKETDFSGHGEVKVKDGQIILGTGVMTGITWTNPVIKMNYEIELMTMRVDGSDFFCALTFPVGEDPCTLIVGGWGGGVVGLSSLDGEDAANNETTKYMSFENNKWFKVKLRVEPTKIQAWIDDDKVIDVSTRDRKLSIRLEVEESKPLGIATWSTTGALKDLRIRKI
jgi:hypothetical protein